MGASFAVKFMDNATHNSADTGVIPFKRLGIISDTHGRIPNGLIAFVNSCDEVIHAGDVTSDSTLAELVSFAAIDAVAGNNDHTMNSPATLVRTLGRLTLAAIHNLGSPQCPTGLMRDILEKERPKLVVYGHTHIPALECIDNTIFLNPGSAGGWGRSHIPCSSARVCLFQNNWSIQFMRITNETFVPIDEPRYFEYE